MQVNIFGSSFFTLTGFHGTHVAIGVLWLLALLYTSLRGGLTSKNAMSLEIAGLYWHFVDIVWIIIFTLVYLIPYDEVTSEGGEHGVRLVEMGQAVLQTFV
jgi:heme/copper-type cytochrome/quinol oxidase subunit 3